MTALRMEIDGAAATLAVLGDAVARTGDPRGLYDRIGASLVASTQKRFEDEKDPEGNPWPASLRKTLFGGRTLTMTARLVQSLTHEPSASGVAVGTNVIYGAIHQFGGIIKAKEPISGKEGGLRFRGAGGGWVRKDQVEIPKRAYLGLDADDETEIRTNVAGWLGAQDDGKDR